MMNFSHLSLASFLVCFLHYSFHSLPVLATGGKVLPSFNPKVPIVCKSKACTNNCSSIPLHLASDTVLEISGGGAFGKRVMTSGSDYDSDDDLLSFAEESDIIIEIRGGSMTNKLNTTPQPLRISTYRKGIRQLKNSERRERRRQKRLERMERRIKRQEDKANHQVYASKLKSRNNMNIKRKVLHASFGLFFATLNQIIPKSIFVPGMTALTSATLAMELLRYKKRFAWMNDLFFFFFGGTLRKQEMDGKMSGSFYYFLGVTISAAFFPTSCASLGICQLALADPSASYFGRQTKHVYWSRIENGFFGVGRNKGILGFLGGAAVCFPFNYYVLNLAKFGGSSLVPGGQPSIALASLALGLAGSFADLCVPTPALTMPKKVMGIPMPRFHVDDNVVVPVFAGFACTKIFEKVGWTNGVDLAKFILL